MYFSNLPDLAQKIKMLDEHPRNAYRIAINGLDKVLKEYTWDSLMGNLLATALPEKVRVTS